MIHYKTIRIISYRQLLNSITLFIQDFLFLYFKPKEKIIVFILEGATHLGGSETISGGIISIDSIYNETKKLKNIHHSKVYLAIIGGLPFLKFSTFKSNSLVFRFNQFFNLLSLNQILLHIPEYLVPYFNAELIEKGTLSTLRKNCKWIHINILNQNIELMPNERDLLVLESFANRLTQTTAHKKYSKSYEIHPIETFHFSTRLDPKQYRYTDVTKKEKVILFSPDDPQGNEVIQSILKKVLPDYTYITIQNITYSEFKRLISKSMFCITLGEGLDGYFIETIFSGGITFTVNNSNFFTDDYLKLPIIFTSHTDMRNNIGHFIKELSANEDYYTRTNKEAFEILAREYNLNQYRENIKKFYNHIFSEIDNNN